MRFHIFSGRAAHIILSAMPTVQCISMSLSWQLAETKVKFMLET